MHHSLNALAAPICPVATGDGMRDHRQAYSSFRHLQFSTFIDDRVAVFPRWDFASFIDSSSCPHCEHGGSRRRRRAMGLTLMAGVGGLRSYAGPFPGFIVVCGVDKFPPSSSMLLFSALNSTLAISPTALHMNGRLPLQAIYPPMF
jgi:hypothetical protein